MSKDSPDFAETRGKTRAPELASPTFFEELRQSMRALEAAIHELGSSELPVLRLAEVGAIPTEMDVETSWQAPVLVSFPAVSESENNGRRKFSSRHKKGAEPAREKAGF